MTLNSLEVVRSFYDCLERGELPAALELVDDEVRWEMQGPEQLPFTGKTSGKRAVADFFTTISAHGEVESFHIDQFLVDGDTVVVLGNERLRSKVTGRAFEMDFADVLVVRDGRIVSFREFCDTGSMAQAYLP